MSTSRLARDEAAPDEQQAACRLSGLAGYYMRKEKLEAAASLLERAGRADPFRRALGRGRLAILQGRDAEAVEALEEARRLDPFDEEAADLLGQLRHARDEREEALEAWADARLLGAGIDPDQEADYLSRIDELLAALGREGDGERDRLFERRASRLAQLAREVEGASPAGDRDGGAAEGIERAEDVGAEEASNVLRGAGLFSALDDEHLEMLADAVERIRVPADASVFREGEPSEDIYVVESGRVCIQRETPFGTQALATVRPGSVFGEMNFIDRRSRSADAVAIEDCELLRISHAGLLDVFESEPAVAMAFLREFWRGLSDKVREANELMKSFFSDEAGVPSPVKPGSEAAREAGRSARLDSESKAGVFQEQGLTGSDLRRLADFAEARQFSVESPVFREGDSGDALFVVLEGKVRISKHIPGVGEEALAILERGGFFGEMALIDDAPRSASAIAHAPDTTVLRIDKTHLEDLVQRRAASAIELLSILCRLLTARLREINDKIVQWRMMTGGFA